jgi:hypothetical protein
MTTELQHRHEGGENSQNLGTDLCHCLSRGQLGDQGHLSGSPRLRRSFSKLPPAAAAPDEPPALFHGRSVAAAAADVHHLHGGAGGGLVASPGRVVPVKEDHQQAGSADPGLAGALRQRLAGVVSRAHLVLPDALSVRNEIVVLPVHRIWNLQKHCLVAKPEGPGVNYIKTIFLRR